MFELTQTSPSSLLCASTDALLALLCPLPFSAFLHLSVFCGYVTAHRGKRKNPDLPSAPPPAKSSFRSTECLLLSLIRQGTCDETESPMRDVLGGKLESRLAALKGGGASDSRLGGSCSSLNTIVSTKPQSRSCSMENILGDSDALMRQQLFLSSDSLASGAFSNKSIDDAGTTPHSGPDFTSVSRATPITCENAPASRVRKRLSVASVAGLPGSRRSRPRSLGSCLDIVIETREEDDKEIRLQGRATSCFNVNAPADQHCTSTASRSISSHHHHPSSPFHSVSTLPSSAVAKAQGSHAITGPSGPRPASSTSNLWTHRAPAVSRRCLSSLDVSKPPRAVSLFKPPVCAPTSSSQPPQPKPEHSKTFSPLRVCVSACL